MLLQAESRPVQEHCCHAADLVEQGEAHVLRAQDNTRTHRTRGKHLLHVAVKLSMRCNTAAGRTNRLLMAREASATSGCAAVTKTLERRATGELRGVLTSRLTSSGDSSFFFSSFLAAGAAAAAPPAAGAAATAPAAGREASLDLPSVIKAEMSLPDTSLRSLESFSASASTPTASKQRTPQRVYYCTAGRRTPTAPCMLLYRHPSTLQSIA